jgi:hypothetical protein
MITLEQFFIILKLPKCQIHRPIGESNFVQNSPRDGETRLSDSCVDVAKPFNGLFYQNTSNSNFSHILKTIVN